MFIFRQNNSPQPYDVEVGDEGQLLGDVAGEVIGGEVECLEIGAVGEEGGNGALEREVRERERELVDAVDGALEEGGESLARVGEGGFGPVLEISQGILQRLAKVGEAALVVGIGGGGGEEEEGSGNPAPDDAHHSNLS